MIYMHKSYISRVPMLLSLILSAEGSTVKDVTILEGMNDLYPIIIQEYSLESTINDKK